MDHKDTIEQYFTAWTERDWEALTELLAEGFTFTTPYDDHITLEAYRKKCWDTVEEIAIFDLLDVASEGDIAFVRYRNTINGEPVSNAEYFTFKDGKIASVEVYFGRA